MMSVAVFVPANFLASEFGLRREVVCLDIDDGRVLWETTVFIAPAERKHSDNSYATPTAATDGEFIAVNFGIGVAGLDLQGNLLWQQMDDNYVENSRYGAVSSPVMVDDRVIVVQEQEQYSKQKTWIAAFDKKSGRIIWRINPRKVFYSYTTPLIYLGQQLLINTFNKLASFGIEDGQFLWEEQIDMQQMVTSMARQGRLVCVAGATHGPKAVIMMRLGSETEEREVLWQRKKNTPGNSSPVIYEGKLFTLTDSGTMICCDAQSGEIFWKEKLKGGRFLASLAAGDGKVYATNTKGLTTVVAADSKFQVLSENDLGGKCYASPAIADGCILMRVGDAVYCIEKASD